MFKLALGGIITLLLLAVGGMAVMHSGMYNVAATDEHLPLVKSVLHSTMHASVEAGAEEIEAPDLSSDSMVQAGAKAYDGLCAACHLKPSLESTVLRAGLNPMPPTFSDSTHQDPAQQFWVIKNGIKMTGMPAWGVTHDDQELWEIVAFLQRLPELSPQDYQDLVRPDSPMADQAKHDGHDHDHGDTSAMARSANDSHEPADDGHDHTLGDMTAMSEHKSASSGSASADAEPAAKLQLADSRQDASSSPQSTNDHYADGHTH
ncbi:cytochrome c [Halomonas taeanensis]|nr:cytochrome c [Halomonas taeanensis]